MNNAEWMRKKGYKFKDLHVYKNYTNDKSWDYRIKIAKTDVNVHVKGNGQLNVLMRWLDAEHVEPILDDVEKRYLSAVIRPFKNRVDWISKVSDDVIRRYFIEICIITNGFDEYIFLPYFDGSEMYKGMESDKKYSLEELGL